MRPFFLIGMSFLALSACSTLDIRPEATEIAPDIPAAPAQSWVEPHSADVSSGAVLPSNAWVQSFNDTKLTTLLDEALQKNTDINAARGRFEASLARADIAGADRLPTVRGQAGISRTENTRAFNPNQSAFSGGINAQWEVDVWRRIRDQIKASDADAAAFEADLAGARLSIAGQVVQTWFDLIEARRLVDLSSREVETQGRALRLTQRRFEGGVTGSSDVRLARSSVSNAQALQASRRQNMTATTRRLEVLLRRYPANELESKIEFPTLPTLSDIGIPSDVLQRRPDIIAANQRLLSSGLNVDIAKKNLLPQISLTGQLSASAPSISELFNIDSIVANVAANIAQPIFQGGRLKANVRQQEALLRTELEIYAGTVLQAYLEVETALNAETRLEERETALQTSVQEALKAEERLELRYTEGLASILQLLDAQSRRISAEGQLISAQKDRLANRVRLHVALGGGALGSLPITGQRFANTHSGAGTNVGDGRGNIYSYGP